MIFVFGPLWSGKRAAAKEMLHCDDMVWDVQELARARTDLDVLADELAEHEVVIATEVGGGVVPTDRAEREARERAGRLNCLLAERADAVVRVFCGIPTLIKGELP